MNAREQYNEAFRQLRIANGSAMTIINLLRHKGVGFGAYCAACDSMDDREMEAGFTGWVSESRRLLWERKWEARSHWLDQYPDDLEEGEAIHFYIASLNTSNQKWLHVDYPGQYV